MRLTSLLDCWRPLSLLTYSHLNLPLQPTLPIANGSERTLTDRPNWRQQT